MTRQAKSWQAIVAAFILAMGLTVVWALLLGWGTSLAYNFFISRGGVRESIEIAADGTPVITARSRTNYVDMSRRTLDGKPWPAEYENWLRGAWLPNPQRPPGLVQFPLSWLEHVAGGTDGKRPPTAWYLLRYPKPLSRAYLAGFDAISHRPIGYIGRQGFRTSLPPANEQFVLPKTIREHLYGLQAGTQYLATRNIVPSWGHYLGQEQRIHPWLIFLAAKDRLVEIDLRKRSVRAVLEIPNLQSISMLSEAKRPAPGKTVSTTDATPGTSPASANQDHEPDSSSSTPKLIRRLALRSQDRIIIYDPPTKEKREFVIPKDIREKTFNVYSLSPQQLLLSVGQGHWSHGKVVDLLWIASNGEVQRKETVELVSQLPISDRQQAWAFAPAIPVPLVWLGKVSLRDPFWRLQFYKDSTYGAALKSSWDIAWPPLLVVLLISLMATAVARHWHRKYHRQQAGRWCLFVFLLGPAGLLAYWLEHRRAVLEPCANCGELAPRDREACAVCDTPFAEPPRIGTEILA